MQPILKVHGITRFCPKRKHARPIIDNISLQIAAGEAVGLVGESGCGKTTLARIIARFSNADTGEIILDGQSITNLSGRQLQAVYRKMQMIFQTPVDSFNPRATLRDGILAALINQGISRSDAELRLAEVLHDVNLSADIVEHYPHEASGGQCQRAAIARALANRPRLLICDEATSSLDVTVQAHIITLLKNLRQYHQLSFLFISHDLALVQQFCDRMLVMQDGQIIEAGNPDDLIARPQTEGLKRLIDAAL